MSSWSAPVYPRRSRSRSPYRGYPGRPPYPDPYGGDPYRSEWDAYDRDRWSGYERERGPYDYARRGRSRSPEDGMSSRFTDPRFFLPWRRAVRSYFVSPAAGRKRRRSSSPWDRDRYEPRPRFDDYGVFTFHPHTQRDMLKCHFPQTPIVEDILPEGHITPPDPPRRIHTHSTTQRP
jgi:hypothetical protein